MYWLFCGIVKGMIRSDVMIIVYNLSGILLRVDRFLCEVLLEVKRSHPTLLKDPISITFTASGIPLVIPYEWSTRTTMIGGSIAGWFAAFAYDILCLRSIGILDQLKLLDEEKREKEAMFSSEEGDSKSEERSISVVYSYL